VILRFEPAATLDERATVEAALREAGIRAIPTEGALLLRRTLTAEQLAELAAMPGVKGLFTGGRAYSTFRVAALGWVSAACAVLGMLVLLAANFPASLGSPADPLRTPEALDPAWPLLPLHGFVERAPDWAPTALLPLILAVLLLLWPVIGRGFARARPRLHATAGLVILAIVILLGLLEATS
jgi:hypothetical protein